MVFINGHRQMVEYEGLYSICFVCGQYGHCADTCPHKFNLNNHPDHSSATLEVHPNGLPDVRCNIEDNPYAPQIMVVQPKRRNQTNKNVKWLEKDAMGTQVPLSKDRSQLLPRPPTLTHYYLVMTRGKKGGLIPYMIPQSMINLFLEQIALDLSSNSWNILQSKKTTQIINYKSSRNLFRLFQAQGPSRRTWEKRSPKAQS